MADISADAARRILLALREHSTELDGLETDAAALITGSPDEVDPAWVSAHADALVKAGNWLASRSWLPDWQGTLFKGAATSEPVVYSFHNPEILGVIDTIVDDDKGSAHVQFWFFRFANQICGQLRVIDDKIMVRFYKAGAEPALRGILASRPSVRNPADIEALESRFPTALETGEDFQLNVDYRFTTLPDIGSRRRSFEKTPLHVLNRPDLLVDAGFDVSGPEASQVQTTPYSRIQEVQGLILVHSIYEPVIEIHGRATFYGAEWWVLNYSGVRVIVFNRLGTLSLPSVVVPEKGTALVAALAPLQKCTKQAEYDAAFKAIMDAMLVSPDNAANPLQRLVSEASSISLFRDAASYTDEEIKQSRYLFVGDYEVLQAAGYQSGSPHYSAIPWHQADDLTVTFGRSAPTSKKKTGPVYRLSGGELVDEKTMDDGRRRIYWIRVSDVPILVFIKGGALAWLAVDSEQESHIRDLLASADGMDDEEIEREAKALGIVAAKPQTSGRFTGIMPVYVKDDHLALDIAAIRLYFKDEHIAAEMGYKQAAPLEEVSSREARLSFSATQQSPYRIYQFSNPQILGRITFGAGIQSNGVVSVSFLQFGHIYLAALEKAVGKSDLVFLDPEIVPEIQKELGLKDNERHDKEISEKAFARLNRLLERAGLNNSGHSNMPIYTQLKNHVLTTSAFEPRDIEEELRSVAFQILNDLTLVRALSTDPDATMQGPEYKIGADSRYADFPAFESSFDKIPMTYEAGDYSLHDGTPLAHLELSFESLDGTKTREVRIARYQGVLVCIFFKQGEPQSVTALRVVKKNQQQDFLESLTHFLHGRKSSPVVLTSEDQTLFASIINRCCFDITEAVPVEGGVRTLKATGLNGLVEKRVRAKFEAGKHVIKVSQSGPLLEAIGYDPELFADDGRTEREAVQAARQPAQPPVARGVKPQASKPQMIIRNFELLADLRFDCDGQPRRVAILNFIGLLVVVDFGLEGESPRLSAIRQKAADNLAELVTTWVEKGFELDQARYDALSETIDAYRAPDGLFEVVPGTLDPASSDFRGFAIQTRRENLLSSEWGYKGDGIPCSFETVRPQVSGAVKIMQGEAKGEYRLITFGKLTFLGVFLDGGVRPTFKVLNADQVDGLYASYFPQKVDATKEMSDSRETKLFSAALVRSGREVRQEIGSDGGILFVDDGTSFTMLLGTMALGRKNWADLRLTFPGGLLAAEKVGVARRFSPADTDVISTRLIGNRGLRSPHIPKWLSSTGDAGDHFNQADFYLVELNNILVLGASCKGNISSDQIFVIPSARADDMKKAFAEASISDAIFSKRVDGILNDKQILSFEVAGHSPHLIALVDDCILEVPPKAAGSDSFIGMMRGMQMSYKKEAAGLDSLGYKAPKPLSKSFPLEYIGKDKFGTWYQSGSRFLLARTENPNNLENFVERPTVGSAAEANSLIPVQWPSTPQTDLPMQGSIIVSEEALPGEPTFQNARWNVPLESIGKDVRSTSVRSAEVMVKFSGLPSDAFSQPFKAGVDTLLRFRFPSLGEEIFGWALNRRLSVGDYGNLLWLCRDPLNWGHYVPIGSLDPYSQKELLDRLRTSVPPALLKALEAQTSLDTRGIEILAGVDSDNGAVFRYQPTDFITFIMSPPEEAKKLLQPTLQLPDELTKKGLRDVPAAFAAEGLAVRAEVDWVPSDYPASQVFRFSQASDRTPDTNYDVTFSHSINEDLAAGDTITIGIGEKSSVYTLRARRSSGFDLLRDGRVAGEVSATPTRITIKIGSRLSLTGEIPRTSEPRGLTISGEEGREQLGYFLQALNRSVPSLYPLVHHDGTHWTLRLSRPESMSQVDFESRLLHAATILKEAAIGWKQRETSSRQADKHISPGDAGKSEEAAANWDLHRLVSRDLRHQAEDVAVDARLVFKGNRARFFSMHLIWAGARINLRGLSIPAWNWLTQDAQDNWQAVNPGPFAFNGIRAPYSTADLQVTRDFSVEMKGQTISDVTWVEHRVYRLPDGNVLRLDGKCTNESIFEVESARLEHAGRTDDLVMTQKGNVYQFSWCNDAVPFEGYEYTFTSNPVASAADVSTNHLITQTLELPIGEASLRLVTRKTGDQTQLVAAESRIGARVGKVGITGRMKAGDSRVIPFTWPVRSFGDVTAQVTATLGADGTVQLATDAEILGEGDLAYVGRTTAEGYVYQHLSFRGQGRRSFLLRPGEKRSEVFSVDGEDYEFRFSLPHVGRLVSARLPEIESLSRPDESDLLPLDSRVSVGILPHFNLASSGVSLPRESVATLAHGRTQVASAIDALATDDSFFLTRDSLTAMAELAVRARAGDLSAEDRTLELTLASSNNALVYRDRFTFDSSTGSWSFAGEGERDNNHHAVTVNGESLPSIYRRRGEGRYEIQPIPPGTTRLYTAMVPGMLGAFVLFNGTGATDFQYGCRRDQAVENFHDFLNTSQLGLLDSVGFSADPRWTVEADGTATCQVEQEGSGSPRPTLTFTTHVDPVSRRITFPHGRTEITVTSGEDTWNGLFQVYERTDGALAFHQINAAAGESPREYRGLILAGGKPFLVDAKRMAEASVRPDFYADGLIARRKKIDAAESEVKDGAEPVSGGDDGESPRPTRRPRRVVVPGIAFEFPAGLPLAGRDLLPHMIDEHAWGTLETFRPDDVSPPLGREQMEWLDGWLSDGGSDFQLLPASVREYEKAQEELAHRISGLDRAGIRAVLPSVEPLYLWLANGTGTKMKVRMVPYLPTAKDSRPTWAFDASTRSEGVQVELIGRAPSGEPSGRMVRVMAPATFDRSGSDQTLKLFDAMGEKGVIRTFRLLADKKGEVFSLYDATERKKPETEAEIRSGLWTSVNRRRIIAETRMKELKGLLAETKEEFRFEGTAPERIPTVTGSDYQWVLVERDEKNQETGRRLRIRYALPYLDAGGRIWGGVAVGIERQVILEVSNSLSGDGDWEILQTQAYPTRDNSIILDHPRDPSVSGDYARRFELSFETQSGRVGYPVVRALRAFETGDALEDFYNPPQWGFHYRVDRVVDGASATDGVGRAQDVTSLYRGRGLVAEGEKALRYHLFVNELGAETNFDLRFDSAGNVADIFSESWEIGDSVMQPDAVRAEIMRPEDIALFSKGGADTFFAGSALAEGSVRLMLRHRPASAAEAVGNSRWLAVDLAAGAGGRFDGNDTRISRFEFARFPTNPLQFFMPGEVRERFSFTRGNGDGRTLHPHGYAMRRPADSMAGSEGAQEITLRFYDLASADRRRELSFVLEPNGVLREGSLSLMNMQTGQKLVDEGNAELIPTPCEGGVSYQMSHRRFQLSFTLAADGSILPDSTFQLVESAGTVRERAEAQDLKVGARLGFDAAWYAGIVAGVRSMVRSMESRQAATFSDDRAQSLQALRDFGSKPVSKTPLGVVALGVLAEYHSKLQRDPTTLDENFALFAVNFTKLVSKVSESKNQNEKILLGETMVAALVSHGPLWAELTSELLNDMADEEIGGDILGELRLFKAYHGMAVAIAEGDHPTAVLKQKLRILRKPKRTEVQDIRAFLDIMGTKAKTDGLISRYLRSHQISSWADVDMSDGDALVNWDAQVAAEVREVEVTAADGQRAAAAAQKAEIKSLRTEVADLTSNVPEALGKDTPIIQAVLEVLAKINASAKNPLAKEEKTRLTFARNLLESLRALHAAGRGLALHMMGDILANSLRVSNENFIWLVTEFFTACLDPMIQGEDRNLKLYHGVAIRFDWADMSNIKGALNAARTGQPPATVSALRSASPGPASCGSRYLIAKGARIWHPSLEELKPGEAFEKLGQDAHFIPFVPTPRVSVGSTAPVAGTTTTAKPAAGGRGRKSTSKATATGEPVAFGNFEVSGMARWFVDGGSSNPNFQRLHHIPGADEVDEMRREAVVAFDDDANLERNARVEADAEAVDEVMPPNASLDLSQVSDQSDRSDEPGLHHAASHAHRTTANGRAQLRLVHNASRFASRARALVK